MIATTPAQESPTTQTSKWAIYFVLPLAFAFFYATALTYLPLESFADRANYLIYAKNSDLILLSYMAKSPATVLSNEPLWLFTNIALAKFFAPETVLRIVIFVPAFLVPWLLLHHNRRHMLLLMLLLLTPQVLLNHIVHLRQGFGIAVFLLGYFSSSRWRGALVMMAAGFIHSALFFIVFIMIFVAATGLLPLSSRLRVAAQLLGFSLLGYATDIVASALGARQVEQYDDLQISFSGLGFVFWGTALLLFLSSGRRFMQQNMVPIGILAFYLATYFVLPVSARIFESGLVLVIVSGLNLLGWRRQIFLLQIFSYACIQYGMSLDSPWLGWGVQS